MNRISRGLLRTLLGRLLGLWLRGPHRLCAGCWGRSLRGNRGCRLLILWSNWRCLLASRLLGWWLRLPLGWSLLRLWPSRAARCFWGTTIRGTRNQIELRLDPEHMIETGG